MKRSESIARVIVILLCLGAVGVPLGSLFLRQSPVLHARMAEAGGWSPQVLHAQAGQPLQLRLTSDDVMHGFAVGQMDMPAVDVEPGRVSEVTLTFERPGTYTFYCTRWCGLNHWRMRGTIEVSGDEPQALPPSQPLYVKLGLDIDEAHPAQFVPQQTPSAADGNPSTAGLKELDRLLSRDYYRSHSPSQAFADLNGIPLNDLQKWNLVAYAWRANTTASDLEEGRRLFEANCAACHGTAGRGDGTFADDLAAAGKSSTQGMDGDHNMVMKRPADLGNADNILGASPALLQGKILRGGMGTGMPMWGNIFTEEQTWNLVAYIFSLQFRY